MTVFKIYIYAITPFVFTVIAGIVWWNRRNGRRQALSETPKPAIDSRKKKA
ncbi:hypothetical protein [Nitrobacter hamburgensis]|uniref:hypothetical protein n=1 Tax=Nitrobacter hamburgensis TaxID=912 RepID=UPI0002FB4569|nr:hypothetical protein [Nitrobacter hamburgensis]